MAQWNSNFRVYIMYWDYVWVTKIDRHENEIWFEKGLNNLYSQNKLVLGLEDKKLIKNPTFLQKYRFVIVNESSSILLQTDETNDMIYTDFNGNRAFNKEVKVLCWF